MNAVLLTIHHSECLQAIFSANQSLDHIFIVILFQKRRFSLYVFHTQRILANFKNILNVWTKNVDIVRIQKVPCIYFIVNRTSYILAALRTNFFMLPLFESCPIFQFIC